MESPKTIMDNFNKEYIEKCIHNPDLQGLWVPKEGDYCLCTCKTCRDRNAKGHFITDYMLDALNNRDLMNVEPRYARVVKFHGQNFVDHFHQCREGIGWIPRQDELQIILKQKIERYKKMTDLKFDFNMRQCIFKSYCQKILCLLTLNDMWLIFFMKEIFGKKWIPERKEWM